MAGTNYSHDEEMRLDCVDRALACFSGPRRASEVVLAAKKIEDYVRTGTTEESSNG